MTGSVDREISEAVAAAGDTTASRLGLRFDRVVVRVLDHLKLFVRANAPEGLTVLLTLAAPIRAPKKIAATLEREIAALLQNGGTETERSVVLHGNCAELRLVERAQDARARVAWLRCTTPTLMQR